MNHDTHTQILHQEALCTGALFGAAWWCIVDAIAYSKAVLSEGFPWTYVLPGVAATLALIFMNLISRDELAEMSDDSSEEGAVVGNFDYIQTLILAFTHMLITLPCYISLQLGEVWRPCCTTSEGEQIHFAVKDV